MKTLIGNKLNGYKILFRGVEHAAHEVKTTNSGSIISFTILRKKCWYGYVTFFNNIKDEFYQLTVPKEQGYLIDKNGNKVTTFSV